MQRIVDAYFTCLKVAIVACLALMVILVFGNVVLRYAFNMGITVSEELSRFLFVWLTFLGAIIAFREPGHLGTDPDQSRRQVSLGRHLDGHVLWCRCNLQPLRGHDDAARRLSPRHG